MISEDTKLTKISHMQRDRSCMTLDEFEVSRGVRLTKTESPGEVARGWGGGLAGR